MPTCKSCGAPIIWAKTPKGKRLPLDPEPVDNGNVILTTEGAVVLGVAVNEPEYAHLDKYVSHFATCPSASSHRKR